MEKYLLQMSLFVREPAKHTIPLETYRGHSHLPNILPDKVSAFWGLCFKVCDWSHKRI